MLVAMFIDFASRVAPNNTWMAPEEAWGLAGSGWAWTLISLFFIPGSQYEGIVWETMQFCTVDCLAVYQAGMSRYQIPPPIFFTGILLQQIFLYL